MSKLTLVIGNKNYSFWSLRPWLWMKHLDLSFDEKLVRLYVDDMVSNLESYPSNYKVPAPIDDDLYVWDSLAILEYLSQQYANRFAQINPAAQAVMRSLCAEMHSSFIALRNEMPMNCRRQPGPLKHSDDCKKDIARIKHLWQ
ncbi:MAG: glutathione S-transferase [Planctomycetota bacterium]|jgi:glutathione S-transferase